MKTASLDSIDTPTLKQLASATRNAAFIEEYRARNCASRFEDVESCDCWACERYGLDGAYADFQLHPDGDYPQRYLADRRCWCWVCAMGRSEHEPA
jgi:hypothetical protein